MKQFIFSIAILAFSASAFGTTLPLDPHGLGQNKNVFQSISYQNKIEVPSDEDIANGLKEALQVGATNAANVLHQNGGYLNNPLVKIPFPPEAATVEQKLRQVGMGAKVDQFIATMNHGAEDAAIKAAPIFGNAITSMNLTDAKNILLGPDNSATMYFKGKTTGALYTAFSPVIKTSLDKVNATKLWAELTTTYNKLPFVKHVETDLVKYVTNKALDGVFIKIAEEEKKIRTSSNFQVTDTLKKVFGYAQSLLK